MRNRLLTMLALAALACGAVAATATAGPGHGQAGKGKLYLFRGELMNASSTSVQVHVEGGNHAALRALLGQSQDQSFALGSTSEILLWHKGVPTVGAVTDLKQGDWVQLRVRAKGSLADVEATPVSVVADRGTNPGKAAHPLFLYRGTVTGPQSGGHIALHVTGGNHLALKLLVGQSADQTFSYDAGTIFLLWQGKVPTVIDPSQLKAGDRITVRIRAPHASTLAQIEATPAVHVGDHEPANAATNV
jgi:hypothetical protein